MYFCEIMGKYYFASDFHLGANARLTSCDREKLVVEWLDLVSKDADGIYLVGDVFDFWFEYKKVIPKGHTRILGKLAEICDSGIPIFFFPGNHDMWVFDYLPKEIGIQIVRGALIKEIDGVKVYIHHGDGLGPGDYKYKFLKRFFASGVCQWLFAALHPSIGMGIAHAWSAKSRATQGRQEVFEGREREWLYQFVQEEAMIYHDVELFIFGHRHLAIDIKNERGGGRYINLGDWLYNQSYGILEEGKFRLTSYKNDNAEIIRDE